MRYNLEPMPVSGGTYTIILCPKCDGRGYYLVNFSGRDSATTTNAEKCTICGGTGCLYVDPHGRVVFSGTTSLTSRQES